MKTSFRDDLTAAIGHWERSRIAYNATLLAVVAIVFVVYLPGSSGKLTVDLFQDLFVLAVLSNVLYCAAYPIDLLARSSGYCSVWAWMRWVVLAVGTAFASVIAEYFARQMFCDGRG